MKSIVTGMSLDDGRRMVWVWGLHGNSFHCDACGTSCPQSVCLLRTSYSVRVPKHWLALPWRCCYWGPRCKKNPNFQGALGKFPSLLHSFRCSLPKWFCWSRIWLENLEQGTQAARKWFSSWDIELGRQVCCTSSAQGRPTWAAVAACIWRPYANICKQDFPEQLAQAVQTGSSIQNSTGPTPREKHTCGAKFSPGGTRTAYICAGTTAAECVLCLSWCIILMALFNAPAWRKLCPSCCLR